MRLLHFSLNPLALRMELLRPRFRKELHFRKVWKV